MRSLFVAQDYQELQNCLLGMDVEVPHHPKDRSNDHVEIYCLVSLLRSHFRSGADFPLEVFRSERPDFVLSLNSRKVGIEHTEATNQNLAKERALRADGHGPEVFFVTSASIHDKAKSKDEVLAQIETDVIGDGWVGDSVERGWAEAMAFFITKKAKSAAKPGYVRYDENQLMIYDSWPAPCLNHTHAIGLLRQALEGTSVFTTFDSVFILEDQMTIELGEDQCLFHHGRR